MIIKPFDEKVRIMIIQLNTDNHIHGNENFREPIIAQIKSDLQRFSEHVTRVDVHLADESKGKTGPHDTRCTIEAHVAGRPSIAVTAHATNSDQAVGAAMDKLRHSLTNIFDRLRAH